MAVSHLNVQLCVAFIVQVHFSCTIHLPIFLVCMDVYAENKWEGTPMAKIASRQRSEISWNA